METKVPPTVFVVTNTSTHKYRLENVAVFSTEALAMAWIKKHSEYYGGGIEDTFGLGIEKFVIDEAPNPDEDDEDDEETADDEGDDE